MERRRFLELLGKSAALVAVPGLLSACGSSDDRIDPKFLNEMLQALGKTPNPLFQKVSQDISTALQSKPQGLPSFVSDQSFPLSIRVDEKSNKALAIFRLEKNQEKSIKVDTLKGAQTIHPLVEKLRLDSIIYAMPEQVKKASRLEQGLFLVKEYTTFMVGLRMMTEYYDLLHPNVVSITNVDGTPLNDSEKEVAGATFFMQQANDQKSDTWRVFDTVPTFYTSIGMFFLIGRGILPKSSPVLDTFQRALIAMDRQPGCIDEVVKLTNAWVTSKTILPPKGMTEKVLSSPIHDAIDTFQAQMPKN